MDEMYDCLRTSKGKLLAEASKTSAEEVFKNVLALLIDKHKKLEVASREVDKYRGECEVSRHDIEQYRIENVRLLGENAGFQATNRVLQDELGKAMKGAPVGLPRLHAKSRSRSRSKSAKPVAQNKPKTQSQSNPEKKTSFLAGVCESVLERLGPCTRGENGGYCQLLHPKDCTEPACHAKGGREATKCDGWHLFKKYSELKAERKERAKATKERKAAEKASAPAKRGTSKKPVKGNGNPGKKAAPPGRQQHINKQRLSSSGMDRPRHSNKGSQVPRVPQPKGQYQQQQQQQQQQFYPPGHQEWAANRQPMAFYSQVAPQQGFQAAPAVPVYNPYHPLSSQGGSGF